MAGYTDPYGNSGDFLGDRGDPKPPYPDDVAERGTKEWRDAFAAMQNWKEAQVAIRGGAGNLEATKKILGDLGFQDVKELGKHAFTMAAETAANAQGLVDQSNDRQWWRGGGGRPLDDIEMESLKAATGWTGGNKGIPADILRQWQSAGGLNFNQDNSPANTQDKWPTEKTPTKYVPPTISGTQDPFGSGMYTNGINPPGPGPTPSPVQRTQPSITQPSPGIIQPPNPLASPLTLGIGRGMRRRRPVMGLGGFGGQVPAAQPMQQMTPFGRGY